MTTADEEEWRPVVGFDNYEVSNHGRVRRADSSARVLSGSINGHGYRAVTLKADGKSHTLKVHRLVALAFLGQPEPGLDVCCHSDGSRDNNRLDNLRWDSHAGNHADKPRHGTSVRGEDSPTATLTEAQVLAIDAALRGGSTSQSEIARRFSVSQGTVGHIAVGVTWGWLTGRANTSQRGSGKRGGRRVRPVKVGN